MKSIFDFKNSISYLKFRLEGPHRKWGAKTQLADFLRIQPAFLSQILAGKFSLSLEQADGANQFFQHSKEESAYFILLVNQDRAGTVSLRKVFSDQIEEVLVRRKSVIGRLGEKTSLSLENQATYYSSWIYPSVHMATCLGHLKSRREIANFLGLGIDVVNDAIEFLEKCGLVKIGIDDIAPSEQWVRLGKNSPFICQHHTNWRIKAIENFKLQSADDLHVSGIYTMTEETALKIKDQLLSHLKDCMKEIENSKEEDLYVLNLDFFQAFKNKEP